MILLVATNTHVLPPWVQTLIVLFSIGYLAMIIITWAIHAKSKWYKRLLRSLFWPFWVVPGIIKLMRDYG